MSGPTRIGTAAAPGGAPAAGGQTAQGSGGRHAADARLPVFRPEATVSTAEPDAVYLGEPLTWHVEVVHPVDVAVKLPSAPDLAPFEILDASHHRESVRGDASLVTDAWDLKVAVYELDVDALPDLALDVVTPDGPAALAIPGPAVTVKSVVAEQGAGPPRELAPPETVWVRDYTLAWGALAFLVSAVAAFLAVRAWRRRRGGVPAAAPAAPPRPLEERTLEALRGLQPLIPAGRRRELYFRASEILRGYLGERFGFDALERTTTELWAILEGLAAPGLDRDRLRRWLEDVDLVKFAGGDPDAAACTAVLQEAVELVRETTLALRWSERAAAEAEDAA